MNSRCFFLYLFLFSLLFASCFEDNDDNGALASEINDFVWKGMNAAYLYKQEIPDLDNDRFNDSEEYANYLNDYTSPENLFESLIYERDNIDKFCLFVDNYIDAVWDKKSKENINKSLKLFKDVAKTKFGQKPTRVLTLDELDKLLDKFLKSKDIS